LDDILIDEVANYSIATTNKIDSNQF